MLTFVLFCANDFQHSPNPSNSWVQRLFHMENLNCIQFLAHTPVENFFLCNHWNFNLEQVIFKLSRTSYPHIFCTGCLFAVLREIMWIFSEYFAELMRIFVLPPP